MPQDQEARITLRIETGDAERDLQRIRRAIGEDAGGEGGGGGGGTGAGRGGGPSGGGGRAPAAPSGGIGLGQVAGIAAMGMAFREALSDMKTAVQGFTDAVSQEVSRKLGMRGAAMGVTAVQEARAQTMGQLGIAADQASDEQLQGLFRMNLQFADMERRGQMRLEDLTRPTLAQRGAAPFAAAVAVGAATYLYKQAVK